MNAALQQACWPAAELGPCLAALVSQAHLIEPTGSTPHLPPPTADFARYIERAAERLGCETTPLQASLGELEPALGTAVPCIVELSPGYFVAILASTKRHLTLLGPDLRRRKFSRESICALIREPFARPHRNALAEALTGADLGSSRESALEALVSDRIAAIPFQGCWTLRPDSGAKPRLLLRQTAVFRNAGGLMLAHLAQYCIWLIAWIVVGRMSLSGRTDRATLLGWALLLATAAPFQILASWLQGRLVVGTGGLLKKRLLAGALKLHPDEVRESGIGSFLAQALEGETVEQLALGGGIAGLLSLLDLCVAAIILGRHSILLGIWFLFLVYTGWRFLRQFAEWREGRFRLTGMATERMVGHRTRLTQSNPALWHTAEDSELDLYYSTSTSLDRVGGILISVIPRGWLILGLASTMPLLMAGTYSATAAATLIGGVLLAYNAFSELAGSFAEIAAGVVGCRGIAALFRAAARPDTAGALLETPPCPENAKVLEADRIAFRYRAQGSPVLESCSLSVRAQDRVLLEGPSGGGKTTLASLLAGVREPASGLLLSGGLDKATLGSSGWSERVISVPQFHENHVLTESFAFNLLLGRNWPPSAADLRAADEVCRRLGLGDLLDRMPNGLLQMVGEGGWQLSHGEKTRLYMARALLQNSDLLILDESFGALDPENMQMCLEYTLERANALLVIAHP